LEQGGTAELGAQKIWPKDAESFHNAFERLPKRAGNALQKFVSYILAGVDIVALASAIFLGKYLYWFFLQDHPPSLFLQDFGTAWTRQTWLFSGLILVALAWFWSTGQYSKRRPFWDELRLTLKILIVIGMLDAALIFMAKWPVSRMWLGTTWMLALFLVPLFRVLAKQVLLSIGTWRQPTVIIGSGNNACRAAEAMMSERLMGYDVIAFIAGPTQVADTFATIKIGTKDIPVFFYSSRLRELLENLHSPHLVVALEFGQEVEQRSVLSAVGARYRNIHVVPPMTGLPVYGTEVDHFFRHEVLLLRVRNNLVRVWANVAKRTFDLIAAALLLVISAPLFLIVALRIKLEDGGPIIFTQERVGRNGRIFKVIKFRSMVVDAHNELLKWLEESPDTKKEYYENNFKLRKDPRVTKIGRWLRRSSIDELPQLWNVVKGEMSLVGPRPLLEREIGDYGQNITLYKQVRPGITGIWQISGRSKTQFSDRANLDAWYIRNWSLWYDLYILLRTIVVVFKSDGAY